VRSETVMKPIRWLARRTARPVLMRAVRWRHFDRKSVTARVREIGGPLSETSAIFPPADHDRASSRLWDLATNLVPEARRSSLDLLNARGAPSYVNWLPGDHYRLLAGLVRLLKPSLVVEIGTYQGHAVLAMLPDLPSGGKLVTFDIVPWTETDNCLLRAEDFGGGRLSQLLADLSDEDQARRHTAVLQKADIILVDAAKDGVLERRLLDRFEAVGLKDGCIVVFDDIRVWNMLGIWRSIRRPKLDLTSLGHYSGTGMVDWSGTPES
jgi:predicted O-methyltransferase YrrM